MVSLTAGTMFLMWLGGRSREWPGERISILIFGGIAAGLPGAVSQLVTFGEFRQPAHWRGTVHLGLGCCVTYGVVFVERGSARSWSTTMPNGKWANRVYWGQLSHLPLKLNMAGVILPSSLLRSSCFPLRWWAGGHRRQPPLAEGHRRCPSSGSADLRILFASGHRVLLLLLTALVSIAARLQKPEEERCLHPGIRPGDQNRQYIDKVLLCLTLIGAIYITLNCVCCLNSLHLKWSVSSSRSVAVAADHRGGDNGLLGSKCSRT